MSADFIIADTETPNAAQPKPVMNAIGGTASMPQAGSSPNTIATSIGTEP